MFKGMRYMKTAAELRRWFADVADVHLRRSRSPKLLPTAYDDLWRSAQRNWKEQRRTKYKTVEKIPTFKTDKQAEQFEFVAMADLSEYDPRGRPMSEVFPQFAPRIKRRAGMVPDDGPCIIVRSGMAYDNFVFVGPFENFAAADQYGQSCAEDELWTIERLVKPEKA
jgi:hypothetical protein